MGVRNKLFFILIPLFLSGIIFTNFVSAGISDLGVEYDDELIGQFLLSDWVHVTIKINDTSSIIISEEDSSDVQIAKDNQKISILTNISNSILSTLSEREFQLEGKFPMGNGFYGNITKEGFDKFLKDSRIKKIYAKKEGTAHSLILSKNLGLPLLLILVIILLILVLKIKRGEWKIKKR